MSEYYWSDEYDVWVQIDANGEHWEVDPSTAALLDERAYVQQQAAQHAAQQAAAREAAEEAAVERLLQHNAQLLADRGEVNAENPTDADSDRVLALTKFQVERRDSAGRMVDS